VWYPDNLSMEQDQPGGDVLQKQFQAFEEMYPDIQLQPRRMKHRGPGSILQYLEAVAQVVPEHLPDLAVLTLDQIGQAQAKGVLQPIEAQWAEGVSFYPFVDRLSQRGKARVALPYEVDIRFLALNATQAPRTVDDMAVSHGYLLPLANPHPDTTNALTLQYHAIADSATGTVDAQQLERVLGIYDQWWQQGIMHTATLTTSTLSQAWGIYRNAQVPMAEVNTRSYLLDQNRLELVRCAPVPTLNGKTLTIGQGWAWCLTTTDTNQRRAAMALLSWIMEKRNLQARHEASGYLPVRRDAWPVTWMDLPCKPVFDKLLEETQVVTCSIKTHELIHAALQDIMAGTETPEQAAGEIASFLSDGRPIPSTSAE
jgi:maltose-binding protein MalE